MSRRQQQVRRNSVATGELDDSFEEEVILQEFGDDDLISEAAEAAVAAVEASSAGRPWGGSPKGKAPNKDRNFQRAYVQLTRDYFPELSGTGTCVYNEANFERRFRVPRSVFDKVNTRLNGKGRFCQRYDATGLPGIHPLCRVTACFRHIAYGDACD